MNWGEYTSNGEMLEDMLIATTITNTQVHCRVTNKLSSLNFVILPCIRAEECLTMMVPIPEVILKVCQYHCYKLLLHNEVLIAVDSGVD